MKLRFLESYCILLSQISLSASYKKMRAKLQFHDVKKRYFQKYSNLGGAGWKANVNRIQGRVFVRKHDLF